MNIVEGALGRLFVLPLVLIDFVEETVESVGFLLRISGRVLLGVLLNVKFALLDAFVAFLTTVNTIFMMALLFLSEKPLKNLATVKSSWRSNGKYSCLTACKSGKLKLKRSNYPWES